MAATYDVTKLFIVRNRIRMQTRDTETGSPRFQDEELDRLLLETMTKHFMWIYLPDDTEGFTSGSVEVKVGSTDMELILYRTDDAGPPGNETSDTFLLSNPKYDTFAELFEEIRDLDKGWQIGLDSEATIHWLFNEPDTTPWDGHLLAMMNQKPVDLQIFAKASVWGSTNKQRLGLYEIDSAVHSVRKLDDAGVNTYDSYTEKDVSWSRRGSGSRGDGSGDGGTGKPTKTIAIPIY